MSLGPTSAGRCSLVVWQRDFASDEKPVSRLAPLPKVAWRALMNRPLQLLHRFARGLHLGGGAITRTAELQGLSQILLTMKK